MVRIESDVTCCSPRRRSIFYLALSRRRANPQSTRPTRSITVAVRVSLRQTSDRVNFVRTDLRAALQYAPRLRCAPHSPLALPKRRRLIPPLIRFALRARRRANAVRLRIFLFASRHGHLCRPRFPGEPRERISPPSGLSTPSSRRLSRLIQEVGTLLCMSKCGLDPSKEKSFAPKIAPPKGIKS